MADIPLSAIFSALAAILFAISTIWYTIDVAKGKITASIATYLMFTIVNFSQLISLITKEVWVVAPFTAVGAITALLVLIFAFKNKKIHFKLLDKIGLAGALLGFIIWLITRDAAFNIYILNFVNLIAFIPLIVKSFKEPHLESSKSWQLNLIASTFLLLSVNSPALYVLAVPLRQFICSLLINIGLYRGHFIKKWRRRKQPELEPLP